MVYQKKKIILLGLLFLVFNLFLIYFLKTKYVQDAKKNQNVSFPKIYQVSIKEGEILATIPKSIKLGEIISIQNNSSKDQIFMMNFQNISKHSLPAGAVFSQKFDTHGKVMIEFVGLENMNINFQIEP